MVSSESLMSVVEDGRKDPQFEMLLAQFLEDHEIKDHHDLSREKLIDFFQTNYAKFDGETWFTWPGKPPVSSKPARPDSGKKNPPLRTDRRRSRSRNATCSNRSPKARRRETRGKSPEKTRKEGNGRGKDDWNADKKTQMTSMMCYFFGKMMGLDEREFWQDNKDRPRRSQSNTGRQQIKDQPRGSQANTGRQQIKDQPRGNQANTGRQERKDQPRGSQANTVRQQIKDQPRGSQANTSWQENKDQPRGNHANTSWQENSWQENKDQPRGSLANTSWQENKDQARGNHANTSWQENKDQPRGNHANTSWQEKKDQPRGNTSWQENKDHSRGNAGWQDHDRKALEEKEQPRGISGRGDEQRNQVNSGWRGYEQPRGSGWRKESGSHANVGLRKENIQPSSKYINGRGGNDQAGFSGSDFRSDEKRDNMRDREIVNTQEDVNLLAIIDKWRLHDVALLIHDGRNHSSSFEKLWKSFATQENLRHHDPFDAKMRDVMKFMTNNIRHFGSELWFQDLVNDTVRKCQDLNARQMKATI